MSKNCVGIDINYKEVIYDIVSTEDSVKAVITGVEHALDD